MVARYQRHVGDAFTFERLLSRPIPTQLPMPNSFEDTCTADCDQVLEQHITNVAYLYERMASVGKEEDVAMNCRTIKIRNCQAWSDQDHTTMQKILIDRLCDKSIYAGNRIITILKSMKIQNPVGVLKLYYGGDDQYRGNLLTIALANMKHLNHFLAIRSFIVTNDLEVPWKYVSLKDVTDFELLDHCIVNLSPLGFITVRQYMEVKSSKLRNKIKKYLTLNEHTVDEHVYSIQNMKWKKMYWRAVVETLMISINFVMVYIVAKMLITFDFLNEIAIHMGDNNRRMITISSLLTYELCRENPRLNCVILLLKHNASLIYPSFNRCIAIKGKTHKEIARRLKSIWDECLKNKTRLFETHQAMLMLLTQYDVKTWSW